MRRKDCRSLGIALCWFSQSFTQSEALTKFILNSPSVKIFPTFTAEMVPEPASADME